jgi:hypothetical protein
MGQRVDKSTTRPPQQANLTDPLGVDVFVYSQSSSVSSQDALGVLAGNRLDSMRRPVQGSGAIRPLTA